MTSLANELFPDATKIGFHVPPFTSKDHLRMHVFGGETKDTWRARYGYPISRRCGTVRRVAVWFVSGDQAKTILGSGGWIAFWPSRGMGSRAESIRGRCLHASLGHGMSLIEDFRCRPRRSIEAEGRYHQSVRKPITRIRHRLQSTRVRLRRLRPTRLHFGLFHYASGHRDAASSSDSE